MGGVSCEKPKKKHRKGLWSPDEDQRLRDYVLTHGHASWTSVPINAGHYSIHQFASKTHTHTYIYK